MNLDAAMPTFVAESHELLALMEGELLRVEQSGPDEEALHAIFRAAHTIKGSAGLFGLDAVVAFTHIVESVLDHVRDGALALHPELVALLLSSVDYMSALVDAGASGSQPTAVQEAAGAELMDRFYVQLGTAELARSLPSGVPVEYDAPVTVTASGGREVDTDLWHISLRFGPDLFRTGMDPLSFIRYLATLGAIEHLVTVWSGLPPLPQLDPESCFIGFEIGFRSEADKAAIEGVFDFVRADCQIRILPPRSRIAEYLRLIADLPGEELKVGEMLVRCGTLTAHELELALAAQRCTDQDARPLGELLVDAFLVDPPVVEAALEKQRSVKERKNTEANLIRVDADKLDQLINLVGELIIAGAGASLAARRAGASELQEATATVSRLVEEVRDSALKLRMVQIGSTFSRFQRIVRDVSLELGKDIELAIAGADTELDKTLVERIGDPLTHLVRNAIDHGIEPAELRLARGKPARGTLQLNAFHESSSVVIEVTDDGGGLNRKRILDKAIGRGLVSELAVLSDHEICELIFEPGFSTADTISNLSGRGVGMDVVRRDIQALRGTVELDSIEGQGSTVRIRLPLTLAIIDGFLVQVGKETYVIPLDMVVECMELGGADAGSGDKRYLNLRGEVLPYRRLREHFNVQGQPARRENIVVVRHGDHKAGLVVDRLLGEFQTVIKPLGSLFQHLRGIAGSTILGSGEVALILDVPGLMGEVVASEQPAAPAPHGPSGTSNHLNLKEESNV